MRNWSTSRDASKVLKLFEIKPDYDLNIMKSDQSLNDLITSILDNLKPVLEDFKPDVVLVHGDTVTTFTASLAAYYQQIKVGHVEAGLRTGNIYSHNQKRQIENSQA